MRLGAWRSLHVRAALVAVPLFIVLGIAMYTLWRQHSAQNALEASQRMNLGLAQYIVEHQEPGLLDGQGRPARERMKALGLHVMMVNPAVEVYLLDATGRVLAHALEGLQGPDPVGQRVDLAPLKNVLGALGSNDAAGLRLPMLGSDPRKPEQPNIFSVATLPPAGNSTGYLYVVLNSNMAQSVNASLANSDTLRAMAIGVAAATALALVFLLLAWYKLTRPLRQLTAELKAFRSDTPGSATRHAGDEIGVLRAAVRAMQERIAQQFQRLEDGDRQRRELVSNISHDLRTPLSSVQGYIETVLLRGDQLDANARATHLRTALRQADLLGRRIGDLFELSKLDAGRVEPRQEVFCLAELLQDVVQSYQLVAQQRGVRLALAAGSHLKAKVQADIAMIERVLQNLIDNALRYTAQGGEVTLGLQALEAHLQISVSDTGRGIQQQDLPHIFERYWRASEIDDAGAPSSSGLGLAIVKRILDLHGSVVRVHSELRRGTRFEFSLPQAA